MTDALRIQLEGIRIALANRMAYRVRLLRGPQADLMVMLIRFRELPDDQINHGPPPGGWCWIWEQPHRNGRSGFSTRPRASTGSASNRVCASRFWALMTARFVMR